DFHVTGVQTCALPILQLHQPDGYTGCGNGSVCVEVKPASRMLLCRSLMMVSLCSSGDSDCCTMMPPSRSTRWQSRKKSALNRPRSEERRVGKEGRARG